MRNPIMPDMPEDPTIDDVFVAESIAENPTPGAVAEMNHKASEQRAKDEERNKRADDAYRKFMPDMPVDHRAAFAKGYDLSNGIVPANTVTPTPGPGIFGHDQRTGERITNDYPEVDVTPLVESERNMHEGRKAPYTDVPAIADIAYKIKDREKFDRGLPDHYDGEDREVAWAGAQARRLQDELTPGMERLNQQVVINGPKKQRTHQETMDLPRWEELGRTILNHKFGTQTDGLPIYGDHNKAAASLRDTIQVFEMNMPIAVMEAIRMSSAPLEVKKAWREAFMLWNGLEGDPENPEAPSDPGTEDDYSIGNMLKLGVMGIMDPTNIFSLTVAGGLIKGGTKMVLTMLNKSIANEMKKQIGKQIVKETAVATGKQAAEGAIGGGAGGLGTGIARPIVSGEEIDPKKVAMETAAGTIGGAAAGIAIPEGFKAVGKPVLWGLRKILKTDPGSAGEHAARRLLDKANGNDVPDMEEQSKFAREAMEGALQENDPANLVNASLLEQGFDQDQAAASSRIVGTLYHTLAGHYGVTPEEMYKAYPFHIRKVEDDLLDAADNALGKYDVEDVDAAKRWIADWEGKSLEEVDELWGYTNPDDYVDFAKSQGFEAAPAYAQGVNPGAPVKIPHKLTRATSMETALKTARSKTYATNRELKADLQANAQAAMKAAGIDPTNPAQVHGHIVKSIVKDVTAALRENTNALGWYDQTLREAMEVMSVVHPELKTDPRASYIFKWALAVTSNGQEVNTNFNLANKAYEYFKANGKFPDELGAGGQARKAIRKGLKLYDKLSVKYGPDRLQKFMDSEWTPTQIQKITGLKIGGELMGAKVKGSAILGPKIGDGFFSNLNGDYSRLTMDRWLMRTIGRWTGQLITDDPARVANRTGIMADTLKGVDAGAAKSIEDVIGVPLTGTPAEVAEAVHRAATVLSKRDALNAIPGGEDIRLAGNALWRAMDGQKEAPTNGAERARLRQAAAEALDILRKNGYKDLTMADMQAALWYPEKRLYDVGKSAEEIAASYAEDAAPDYANAAVKLAMGLGKTAEELEAARVAVRGGADGRAGGVRPGAGPGGPGSVAAGGTVGAGRPAGFDPKERIKFAAWGVFDQLRAGRGPDGQSPWTYKRTGEATAGRSGSIAGEQVPVVNEFKPEIRASNTLKAIGLPAQTIYETADPVHFHKTISELNKTNKWHASVKIHSPEAYAGMRTFMSDDGLSGLALTPDGTIISGFNAKPGSGAIHALVEVAIQEGGRKGDCFDTVLPPVYAAHGLKPVARVKWNDEYAPVGWDKEVYKEFNNGEPDVVLMVYDPAYRGRGGKNEGVYAPDWDAAVALQGAEAARLGDVNYQGVDQPRLRGSYEHGSAMARVFSAGDASTIPHETAHHYLALTGKLASEGEAPASLKREFAQAMEWLGTDTKSWEMMTPEQRRPFHEKFAQGFEVYLMEGTAPTPALQRIFEAFKEWLTKIYKSTQEVGGEISEGARAYFDRILRAPQKPIDPYNLAPSLRAERLESYAQKAPVVDVAKAKAVTEGILTDLPTEVPEGKYIESGTINVERAAPGARADRPPGQVTIEDFNNMQTADELAALLNRVGDEMGFKEGPRTKEEVTKLDKIREELAPILGGTQVGLASDRQLFAMRSMVLTLGTETINLAKQISKAGKTDPETVLKYQRTSMALVAVQSLLTKNVREIARALAQQNYIAQLFSKNDIYALKEGLQDITDPDAIIANAQAMVAKMDNGVDPNQALGEGLKRRTRTEALIEFWTANILSGPQTHVINFTGNILKMLYDQAMITPFAAVAGKVQHKLGRQKDYMTFREVRAGWAGAAVGLWDGLNVLKHVIMEGESALETRGLRGQGLPGGMGAQQNTKYGRSGALEENLTRAYPKHSVAAARVSRAATFSFTMLTAEDEIFKTSAYRSEAARLAAKAGIDLGLEGKALTKHIADTLRKIPDEMHRKALQAAKVATFQDDTMGGGWLGKMSHHARMMTKDVPALKFVVPFITTPANVVRAGIEASALPWLNPKMVYDATQPGAAGNVKAAKLAGGAIMTVLAYSLYHAGIITGDGPDDMEQRKVLEADEWQKNSIRVGDTYLSYDRLDPVATPFVVTATFFDRSRFQRREHELIADTGAALWAAGTHFFELPFLQGVQNLSKLPDQGWKGIGKLVGKTASGFIPFSSLIATIARVDDPEATGVTGIKAGFGGDGVALDTIDEAMAQLQSRTPFWRDGLRPARNWDSSIQMAPLGGLLVPFNPMPARVAKNDNATGALIRYGVTSPEPTPMLNIGRGISVNLLDFDGGRGAVYDAFLVGVGKARREAVIDAMENSAAFTLTEAEDMHGERALALQTAIQKGKERGTSEFLRETLPALVAKGEINLAPIAKLLEDEGKAGVIDAIREEGRKSTRAEGRFEDTRKPKRIINPSGTGVRLQ